MTNEESGLTPEPEVYVPDNTEEYIAREEPNIYNSNLMKHADREMRLVGLHEKDSDYGGKLYDAVMDLMQLFASQGHSGFSASKTVSIFNKVARYENLSPLTGEDDEWNDVCDDCYQNNRVSSVFKEKATGKAYYLDAIVWNPSDNLTYTGNVDGITSRQYIKSFPFNPKTFYIDVVEFEDRDTILKNREDLKAVFEYYNQFGVDDND